jgi:hypothetical protein
MLQGLAAVVDDQPVAASFAQAELLGGGRRFSVCILETDGEGGVVAAGLSPCGSQRQMTVPSQGAAILSEPLELYPMEATGGYRQGQPVSLGRIDGSDCFAVDENCYRLARVAHIRRA